MLGLSSEKTDSPKGLLSNLLNIKTDAKDDKFSLLLKSFSFGKTDKNDVLNGLKLGLLDDKSTPKGLAKLDTLLKTDIKGLDKLDALLQVGEKADSKKEVSSSPLSKLFALGNEDVSEEELIHADILKALPTKEFKQSLQQLIGEAKSYLKDQINKKIDIKELPKTLGGLIKLAEKSGIDVRAIDFASLPKSAIKDQVSQVLDLTKPIAQNALPHSTSQLVKPVVDTKKEPSASQKPLDALLNKNSEALLEKGLRVDDLPKTMQETPQKTAQFNASLNALLHGESSEVTAKGETETTTVKVEGDKGNDKTQLVHQNKVDPLASKITEAKQLVQHVAQSMKEAVENYKPPFTRIKMQLNPQKFGEMDVTLIQRGNNVHININASSSALTLMMQNAHELKSQLAGQGLGDASMNFSSHQQQQGEKQKQEHAGLSYEEYQDFEEEFTEIATALEVVVPRYI